jgi:hypothetical protein
LSGSYKLCGGDVYAEVLFVIRQSIGICSYLFLKKQRLDFLF